MCIHVRTDRDYQHAGANSQCFAALGHPRERALLSSSVDDVLAEATDARSARVAAVGCSGTFLLDVGAAVGMTVACSRAGRGRAKPATTVDSGAATIAFETTRLERSKRADIA